jgi:Planctomycete cytochrome C
VKTEMIATQMRIQFQQAYEEGKPNLLNQITTNHFIALSRFLCLALLISCLMPSPVQGAGISRETRKELTALKKDLGQVARFTRSKEFEEGRTLLKDIDSRLKKLIISAGLKEKNSLVKQLKKTIAQREKEILKRDAEGGPVFDKTNMKKGLFSDSENDKEKKGNREGKVSFTRDIAPFMVNLCLRCHNSRKMESDFSLETFSTLMKGGDNGSSITPGNLDRSYLWSLVGKQDPIKMPQGQARITRKNWTDLKSWILEGAKYDGQDANAKLRDLVPSENEMSSQKLRALSKEEFQKLRADKTKIAWKKFNADQKPAELITDELLLIGNVDQSRLQVYAKLLEEGIQVVRQLFKIEQKPLFRGRLAVFVLKDRFSFDEFHFMIEKKEIPKEMLSSFKLTGSHEDAWMVFHDDQQKDEKNYEDGLSFPLLVTSRVIETYLSEENSKMPFWIRKGAGLAALSTQKKYGKELESLSWRSISILKKRYPQPKQLFRENTFINSEMNPISLTFVRFFVQQKGNRSFLMFINEIHKGTSQSAAMMKVYGQSSENMGRLFYKKLR